MNVSLSEKVAMTSDACVASAPFGRNDELLFDMKIKVAYLKNQKPSKIPQNIFELFTAEN